MGFKESKRTIAILLIALVYVAVGISSLWWLPPVSDSMHRFFEGSSLLFLWYTVLGVVLIIPLIIVIGLQIYVFARGTPRFSRIIAAYVATVLCFAAFYTIISIDGEWHTAEATYDLCVEIAPHVGEELTHEDTEHGHEAEHTEEEIDDQEHWIGNFLQPDGTYQLHSNHDAFAGTRSRVFWLKMEGFDYEINLAETHLTAIEIQAIAATSEHEALTFHLNHGVTRVLDMLYFSVATISTLGYGDIRPMSNVAVSAVVLEVLMGLSLALLGVGFIFAHRQQVLEKREDRLEAKEMNLEAELESARRIDHPEENRET